MRSWHSLYHVRFAAVLAAVFVAGACAAPMQPGRPVDKSGVTGFHSYQQDGKRVDRDSMLDTLQQTPAAQDDADRAKVWGIAGSVASAVGGLLIGWPIGDALSDSEEDPNWTLAYVGGGVMVVGIGLSVLADSYLSKAVDSYNGSLGTGARGPRAVPAVSVATDVNNESTVVGGVAVRF